MGDSVCFTDCLVDEELLVNESLLMNGKLTARK